VFNSLPYLTADLPGIGGVIKQAPEDFVVEEIPAYESSGEGEHLFLRIEKRDVAAEQLTRHIAKVLHISNRDIGVAGLKDRIAITRQYVSVPAGCEQNIGDIETDAIRILSSAKHQNKLRTGHLKGNRFSILVRSDVSLVPTLRVGTQPSDAPRQVPDAERRMKERSHAERGNENMERAQHIAEQITEQGFPNYYGQQRFGHDGQTLALGLDLLRGTKTPRDLPGSRRRYLLRFSLSAVQSFLFNQALAARLTDGLLHHVLPGDVMQVCETGGIFVVEDAVREQHRFDDREITITGPMFGIKMRKPEGDVLKREFDTLPKNQLTFDQFREFKKLMPGTRRPYLVIPEKFHVEPEPAGIRFRFTLPSGVYATTLLREFQKTGN
jgi:tRNA pseudouridine13 synthase